MTKFNRRNVLKATAVSGSGLAALAYSPKPTLAASDWTVNSPSTVSNDNGELSSLEIPSSGFSFSLDYSGLGSGSHSISFKLEAKISSASSFESVFSDSFSVEGDSGSVTESELSASFPVDLLANTSMSAGDFEEPNAGDTNLTPVELRVTFEWNEDEYSASDSATESFDVSVTKTAPTDGLIAHYPFNNDASDATGNGNDGTVNDASYLSSGGPQGDGAYSFDGSNDWIDITGIGVPSQITYGGWIKFDTLPSENSRAYTLVALNDDGGPANSGAWVGAKGGDEFGLELGDGGGGYFATSTGNAVQKDTWYHIMVTYSSTGEVNAYLDGSLVLTDSYGDGNLVEGSRIQQAIGANSSTARLHDGVIDDVRIYNRSLSDSEVQTVYDATKP